MLERKIDKQVTKYRQRKGETGMGFLDTFFPTNSAGNKIETTMK